MFQAQSCIWWRRENYSINGMNSNFTYTQYTYKQRATNRQVAGSIPDGVIGIFHWLNPSGRTMTLGVDSTSNTNEYQEVSPGSKGSRCVPLTVKAAGVYRWQPSYLRVPTVYKFSEPQRPGALRASAGNYLPVLYIKVRKYKDLRKNKARQQ